MTEFKNRVFGCVAVKAINSNYNADFSGQPRTLPNGKVYATDKALKYPIKNYLKEIYGEKIFYFKVLNDNLNPISLSEAYKFHFGEFPKDNIKKEVAQNLLSCVDIRIFGATFTANSGKKSKKSKKSDNEDNEEGKIAISLHGPLQINHGMNIWHEDNIYTEQITSPFSNKADDPDKEKNMTTLGQQSRLEEGHYMHHFSINPQNLRDVASLVGESAQMLSVEDIEKLKEAMRRGVTYYDSSSKAGCENELLVWIQLKEGSKAVLPNLMELILLKQEKKEGKCVYDFTNLKNKIEGLKDEIECVEVYYDKQTVLLNNLPESVKEMDL